MKKTQRCNCLPTRKIDMLPSAISKADLTFGRLHTLAKITLIWKPQYLINRCRQQSFRFTYNAIFEENETNCQRFLYLVEKNHLAELSSLICISKIVFSQSSWDQMITRIHWNRRNLDIYDWSDCTIRYKQLEFILFIWWNKTIF